MVTVKHGIFDSQSAGYGNPGARAQDYYKMGAQVGAPGVAAQQNALTMFGNAAQGQGPSLAQTMLRQQSGQIQRGNMAMMQGARGGNIAGAYNTALGANAGQQAGLAQQAAIVQAQEQLANRQAYAQQAAQMAQQQLAYEQLAQQGLTTSGQQNIDWQLGRGQLDLARDQFQWGRNKQIGDMIIGGSSALMKTVAMSDIRSKEDVQPVDAADAVAQVEPIAYRYKPGLGQPGGQQIGVSAQQLRGTPLASLVHEMPNGFLGIDAERAGLASLAASSENARRIRMMEQRLAMGSGEGSDAQRFGTREEGARNEQLARQWSDSIAAQRGAAQVQRGQGGPAYDFSGSPQMRRGGFDRGNVNLHAQPEVRNPDGSISTVDSASYNLGGRETLLPSVTPDGRHLQSDEDILAEYRRTGRHLGQFASPQAASSYARELHDAYANGAFRPQVDPFTPNTVGPNTTQGIAGLRQRYFPELVR